MRHIDRQQACRLIDQLLCSELSTLRQLPYAALVQLPSRSQRPVKLEEREATLSTWRDLLPDSTVRVVTQYYRPGLLGSARVRAKGFVTDSQDVARELAESELWDFT